MRFSLETGMKFCTNCNSQRPVLGGRWIVSTNGKSKRWRCGVCEGRRNEARQRALAEISAIGQELAPDEYKG